MRGYRGKRSRALGFWRVGLISLGVLLVPQSALADPAEEGSWGPLQNYPVVPVSMGVLPDGKIVAWDQANTPPNFGPVPNNGAAMVLDPQTGQITRSANVAPRSTFCSLLASLPDGRLAIIGGGANSSSEDRPDVQIYDAGSRTFSALGQMNQPRWYPGGTLDRDGNPIVAGGSNQGIEEFDQLTGTSTSLNTTFPANWYPDLLRVQNGDFLIEDVGDLRTTEGRYRLSGTSLTPLADETLLKERLRGVRTLIGPHTMFYNSGGLARESMIIDASSGTPSYTSAASSQFPHMTGQAVTLPTGEVLVVGGNSSGSGTKGTPVMTPELYSPATNSWTSMDELAKRRTYHSVSALLPDGRVWAAGSSFEEIQEPNGQFFSPPYLFRDDGSGQLAQRPTATGAPESVTAGQTFSINTDAPGEIAYASFIRLAATTHQVNAGQAFVQRPVTAQAGSVRMQAPSVDQAPPGYYMVFLINEEGVPSVAPVVRMHPSNSPEPEPRVVQVSQRDISTQAWNAFDGSTAQGPGARIARTLDTTRPWWDVDLGLNRDIENVRLRFPTTCCENGNRDLWLLASEQPIRSTDLDTARSQPGVTSVRVQTPIGQDQNLATVDTRARYLRVQSTATNTSLGLAEVELVDASAPNTTITSGPTDGETITDRTPSFGFSSTEPGSSFQCSIDSGSPSFTPCSGPGATHTPASLSDGTYTFRVRATDSAGNPDPSPASRSFTVDASAPQTTITSGPTEGETTSDDDPSFRFEGTPAADVDSFECRLDSGNDFSDCTSPHSFTDLADGTYTFEVRAIDAHGNADGTPAARSFTVVAPSPAPPRCRGVEATIVGTDDDDRITGTSGRDVIYAGGGDDEVSGRGGKDRICGGDGEDSIESGARADRVAGGGSGDDMNGGGGKDKLNGNDGPDRLMGGRGHDAVRGGSGKDRCRSGGGSDDFSSCEA
jgi:Domain of unknown function (DUF1929)/RTX calcium-binding nonapeptide repeat (4 copies)/Bacterial Ig-like domain